jgi:hypothetical protein
LFSKQTPDADVGVGRARHYRAFRINSGDQKEGNEPLTLVQNWPAELKK